jgi:hypothetical protein
MSKHYYVGREKGTRKFKVLLAARKPTEGSHGRRYVYAIGPFRSKAGAMCMAKYGDNNPHLQTVVEAERAAKTWCR